MDSDEIRELVQRWVRAVQAGDLDAVRWVIAHEHHSFPDLT